MRGFRGRGAFRTSVRAWVAVGGWVGGLSALGTCRGSEIARLGGNARASARDEIIAKMDVSDVSPANLMAAAL